MTSSMPLNLRDTTATIARADPSDRVSVRLVPGIPGATLMVTIDDEHRMRRRLYALNQRT